MTTDKESKLNQIEKTAQHYEEVYHGCSRCVFKALQEHLNLGDGATVKAATPFAAGIAMRGETCGALLGGLMALGIVTASENFEDEAAQFGAMAAAYRLARKVEKEFGSTQCKTIQTEKLGQFYSLADPQQYEAFVAAGGYVECPKVVGKIARMTGAFILEYLEGKK